MKPKHIGIVTEPSTRWRRASPEELGLAPIRSCRGTQRIFRLITTPEAFVEARVEQLKRQEDHGRMIPDFDYSCQQGSFWQETELCDK